MSRALAYLAILVLLAVGVLAIQPDDEEEPEPDLGDGYAYREDTLRQFRRLLDDGAWSLASPPRNPQGMLEAVHAKTGLTFVLIPMGTFQMGSPESEVARLAFEGPVHRVAFRRAFLLCETECTQEAWDRGGGKNTCMFKGADLPVEGVTLDECQAWCEQNCLRLPSEAEWEYACRAGTTTPFSFGGAITHTQVNSDGSYPYGDPAKGEDRKRTVACGSLPANPWGLFEMHGNVSEWCEDEFHSSYVGAPPDGTAWVDEYLVLGIARGGSWNIYASYCRSAFRFMVFPSTRGGSLGFRPAADLPE